MEIFYLSVTLASAIAGILAWIAKLRWSKEFKEAKLAQIEALKQQIETLKKLTSEKLLDHLIKTKQGLEAIIEEYEGENEKHKAKISELEKELSEREQSKEDHKTTKELIEISNDINDKNLRIYKSVNDLLNSTRFYEEILKNHVKNQVKKEIEAEKRRELIRKKNTL